MAIAVTRAIDHDALRRSCRRLSSAWRETTAAWVAHSRSAPFGRLPALSAWTGSRSTNGDYSRD